MLIKVNGQSEETSKGMNVAELIKSKGINPDTVVVELNREIIKSDKWGSIVLKENDNLEILRFVGGG